MIAVDHGKGDAYSDALPIAYIQGRVSYGVANESFAYAAITVVTSGVTPEQGRVGGLAVIKTNAAYLTGSL